MPMKKAAHLTGFLSKEVTDGKKPLAKDAKRHLSKIVKEANGSLTKFDVTNGEVFFELKDDKGLVELQAELSKLPEVTLEEVSPVKLVFLKAQAQAQVAQKAM